MPRRVLLILLVLTAFFHLHAALPPGPSTGFTWTAYPEAGDLFLSNPAGCAFLDGARLRLGISADSSSITGLDRASLVLGNTGIYGWWDDGVSMRSFNISSAYPLLNRTLSLGIGYSWYDPTVESSVFKGRSSYTFGLLYRPLSMVSGGISVTTGIDLPGEDDVETLWRGGLGFRPFGDRLTLTFDMDVQEDWSDPDLRGGMEIVPLEGLALRGSSDGTTLSVGMRLDLGRTGLTASSNSRSGQALRSSSLELDFASAPGPDLLRPSGRFIVLRPEGIDEMITRPFLGSPVPCFTEIALALEGILEDGSVDGVLVYLKDGSSNSAQAEELRGILRRLRVSGRKVYFFMEGGNSDEYYLASSGDGIWLHPCARISFSGLSSTSLFLRDFLDRLGIYPDLQHIGEYKSASEMFTRSDMSPAQGEATTALLSSMQEELIEGVSTGRGLDPGTLHAIMNAGPYAADWAITAGLADGICYEDEFVEAVERELQRSITTVTLNDYRSSIPEEREWGPERHIAVVVASGMITRGSSGSSFPTGRIMGSDDVCDALHAAASQPGVAGIVLRIDSPGGDALASADMHHAVETVMESVPVVVSMGGVAASGGYYMACGADRIYADRMTVTGSIGIISGKFSFGGLLDSLGIHSREISTAPMAGMDSSMRPYTDDERGRARDLMAEGYRLFVETVALGRDMDYQQVDSLGRGRVWSGSDALENGLVDRCAGVVQAVEYAWELAGEDPAETPRVMVYPEAPFPGTMPGLPLGVGTSALDFISRELYLYLMEPLIIE